MAEMSQERAREITGSMVALIMASEGVDLPAGQQPNLEILRGYSLAEMVEANRLVREAPTVWTEHPNGTRTGALHMHVTDPLTAAIYVALHYPPKINDGRKLDPIIRVDGAVLLLLQPAVGQEEEDDG